MARRQRFARAAVHRKIAAAAEQERTDQTPAAHGILPLQGTFIFRIRGQTATRALPWVSFFWYGPQNQTFVDVFDAAQLADVRRRVLAHAQSAADNPWVLGLGGPNLQIWDGKLVRRYRELPPAVYRWRLTVPPEKSPRPVA